MDIIGTDAYQDLSTKVYNRLKAMILSGELEQGQKLKQEQLAVQLGVSRTPLLQATSRLAKDRLVELVPRRGAFVRTVSKKEMLDAFDVRCCLEPLCAELAAQRITDEELSVLDDLIHLQQECEKAGKIREFYEADCKFHSRLMKYSGNTYAYDFLKNTINMLLCTERFLKTPQDSIREHKLILQALREHVAYAAKSAMSLHLDSGAKESLRTLLQKEGEEPDGTC